MWDLLWNARKYNLFLFTYIIKSMITYIRGSTQDKYWVLLQVMVNIASSTALAQEAVLNFQWQIILDNSSSTLYFRRNTQSMGDCLFPL